MKAIILFLAWFTLVMSASTLWAQTFTNVQVTTNTLDQSETAVAISPLSTSIQLAAWNDTQDDQFSQPGFGFTTNGGNTWALGLLPDVINPSLIWGFDPSVAFDRSGNAYYCYIASSGGLGPVYVARTTTFQPPFTWQLTQVSTLTSNLDKPYMGVDNYPSSVYNGRVYVSWTDFNSGSAINFAYSTNQGQTFSSPITLTTGTSDDPSLSSLPLDPKDKKINETATFVQGSVPTVAPNGDL